MNEGRTDVDYFHGYSVVGLVAVIGVLFVCVAFASGRLLRPVRRGAGVRAGL